MVLKIIVAYLVYSLLLIGVVSLDVSKASIVSVTLTNNMAEINKTFIVNNIDGGYHSITISDLPPLVDEKSIAVAGTGDAELLSTAVIHNSVPRSDDRDFLSLVRTLEDVINNVLIPAVQRMKSRKNNIEDRTATAKSFVKTRVEFPKLSESSFLNIEQVKELLDFQDAENSKAITNSESLDSYLSSTEHAASVLSKTLTDLLETGNYNSPIASLPQSIREMEVVDNRSNKEAISEGEVKSATSSKRIEDVLPRDSRYWPASNVSKSLSINVFVPNNDKAKRKQLSMSLAYMIRQASWSADYDIRLSSGADTDGGKYELTIAFYAVVIQSTGEDWEKVQLTLSTANTKINSYSPRPRRKKVQYYVKPRQYEQLKTVNARARTVDMNVQSAVNEEYEVMAEAFMMDAAADDVGFMRASGAVASSTGDLGATYVFTPHHPVTVASNTVTDSVDTQHRRQKIPQQNVNTQTKTRLFIDEMSIKPLVYSYIVPTMTDVAYLKAWGDYTSSDSKSLVPLLTCNSARIFLQGAYSGVTNMLATQPGGYMRLNLGEDKNIKFSSAYVYPREGSKEEDKSTWFVTDKVKYNVQTTEHAFSVKNTHEEDHLVVLSDYLPHPVGDGITVELIEPKPSSVIRIKKGSSEKETDVADSNNDGAGDVWSEEDFLETVLAHPTIVEHPYHPLHQTHDKTDKDSSLHVFLSKGSNNIVWVKWMKPGETMRCGLKYKVIWPDGKEIRSD